MSDRILFMIIDNEVKYLENSTMDHREWYKSLNLDIDKFDNIIRGFIMNNKIIFYKGFFNYDNETIKVAEYFYPSIKEKYNNPNLEVYCGVVPGKPGEKWEPILRIDDKDVSNNRFDNDMHIEKKKIKNEYGEISKELKPIIDVKNNYNDTQVVKNAMIMTLVVLVLDSILKIILFTTGSLHSSLFDIFIVFGQFVCLILSLVGYIKGIKNTQFISFAAAIFIILSFNIFDIILGFIYFVYSIDQSFINKIISKIKVNHKNK